MEYTNQYYSITKDLVLLNEIRIYHGDVMVGYYNPDSPL